MLVNIFGLFFMVILVLLLVWAAFRARRARNSLLKWGGMVLSGLLALVLLALSAVTLTGLVKFYSRVNTPVPNLQVAGTSEQVQRGEHIANAFCASCHSTTGEIPLAGGVDLGKDFPAPLGRYVSVNLTPAGHLQNWSDGEIFRAIRNGIDRNGRKLVIMGNFRGRHLSDEDVQALIAYLRSQPAVQNETLDPPDQPNLMALVMFGAGLIPAAAPPTTASIEAPPKAPTQEYGAYLRPSPAPPA